MSSVRAKELGCQRAISQSTNYLTQIILAQAGYYPMKAIECKNLPVDGKHVLDLEAMGNSTTFKIMVKDLTV